MIGFIPSCSYMVTASDGLSVFQRVKKIGVEDIHVLLLFTPCGTSLTLSLELPAPESCSEYKGADNSPRTTQQPTILLSLVVLVAVVAAAAKGGLCDCGKFDWRFHRGGLRFRRGESVNLPQ